MTIKSTLPLLLAFCAALGASGAWAAEDAAVRLARLETGTAALANKVGYVQVAESKSDASSSVAADFEVRLQRLEQTLSELNGRVEQSGYDIQQLKDRVERMSGDYEFRFQALEKTGGAPPPGGKPGAAPVIGGSRPAAPAADDAPAVAQPTKPAAPTAPQPPLASASGSLKLPGDRPSQPAAAPAPAAATGGSTGDAQTDYDRAYNLLRTEDWEKAEKALSDFVKRYPKNPMAGNAQYWLGETFYVRKKYNDAAVAFAEGFKTFPTNNKAPDNLLKLGLSLSELGRAKEACTAYDELTKRFPGASPAIKRRADAERRRLACK